MIFVEEASIKILSGLLSNPSIVQKLPNGNWIIAGDTKDLANFAVSIAKNLKASINTDSIENNHNTTFCEVCGKI